MTKKIDLPLILLAIAAFLTPLIGGHISTDAMAMDSGGNSLILALQGASEAPTLSHAILTALCSIAIIVLLWQRKILQLPNNTVSGLLLVLFAIIIASVGYSEFKSTSLPAGLEWLAYGTAFYAVVAATGRQKGPKILVASLFVGCVILALLGIQEYGANKAIDPTHRIFPQWAGPNAMAAILVVGFFLGVGLAANVDRLKSLGVVVGCVAIGVAIFLTQSKGAILALAICLILYSILLVAWLPRKNLGRSLGVALGVVALVAMVAGAMSFRPSSAPGSPSNHVGSPLGRFADSSLSADQSVGFRSNLWKSAIKLIERNPIGAGIDTFQFDSAEPGLVTQTHLAHQTYLQLAEEASPLALALLIGAFGYWSILVARGGSKLESKQNILRASVAAAVVSVLIHSFVDSDLYYFGVGMAVFMLLGVGLLLSTDAVAPEFLPPVLRRSAIVGVAAFTLLLNFLGFTEGSRSQVRGYIGAQKYDDAKNQVDSLRAMEPWDSDTWALSTQVTRTEKDRIAFAKQAVELAPSTHNLRTLARVQAEAGMVTEATSSLQRALQRDPNNLLALTLLTQIQFKAGFDDEAKKSLDRLIQVEQSSYFTIRSLPELVPTETYFARIQRAALEPDPQNKIEDLQIAVNGLKQYVVKTIPNVIRFAEGQMDYGGESLDKAKSKMTQALGAAKDLAAAY